MQIALILLCVVGVGHWPLLPISFRVTSQALGQSYDCPSACEVILTDIGKIHFDNTQECENGVNISTDVIYIYIWYCIVYMNSLWL